VPASLSSGRAKKVGTGRPNGTLQLAFTALLPHELDLSQATVRIHQVLAEGGAELVEISPGPGLDLQRLEGAKRDRASFATLAGVQPLVRLQFQSRAGVLESTLRIDQAEVAAPQLCGAGPTKLVGEMVISDGQHPSLRVQLRGVWECARQRNGKVKGLELVER
jgi:hypothetical protein